MDLHNWLTDLGDMFQKLSSNTININEPLSRPDLTKAK